MAFKWGEVSSDLREWYRTIKQNSYKGPLLLMGLGLSCVGQDNFFLMILFEFVLDKFFNYQIPGNQNELVNMVLRNAVGICLIIYGAYLFWKKAHPSDAKEKVTLVLHEILRSFDKKELRNVLKEFNVKFYHLNFTRYFKSGQLTELDRVLEKHKSAIDKVPGGTCVYFGHAHIPFIVLTSFLLSKRSIKSFERDHKTGEYRFSWRDGDEPDQILLSLPEGDISCEEQIAIKVSFSVKVSDDQVYAKLGNHFKIASLSTQNITLRSIKGKKELDNFIAKYRELNELLKDRCPNLKVIHLFVAAPPSIPLRIGAMLSQTHDPELRVYNWTNETGYSWGISIQKGTII